MRLPLAGADRPVPGPLKVISYSDTDISFAGRFECQSVESDSVFASQSQVTDELL